MRQEYELLNYKFKKEDTDSFLKADPFPHIIIDNFLKEEVADSLYENFPDANENFWYEYNNKIEIKLACNDLEHLPIYILGVLAKLNSQHYLNLISKITNIQNLKADPTMHGGGMHCIKSGGKLDMHVDYSIHPYLALERRLNLIIYLNKNWQEEYGGYLELWEKDMSKCAKRILPIFNRAVIFSTSDESWHGHPDPLSCPQNMSRKSIALYYLTEPRELASSRSRAQFVARPDDDYSQELENIRKLRSNESTAKTVYKI